MVKHRRELRKNTEFLSSLSNIRKNPHLAANGITDDILGNIKGWGNTNIQISAKEILDNLDAFLTFKVSNNINCNNCEAVWNIFKTNAGTSKQGMYWTMEHVRGNPSTFANKTLDIEFQVPRLGLQNNGRIDVRASGNGGFTLHEYKWYGSDTPIAKTLFLDEFIRRDLHNVTDLSQMKWHIKGTSSTLPKSKVIEYLQSVEGRNTLGALGYQKAQQFFPNDQFLNQGNYVDRIISNLNKDSFFQEIFKYLLIHEYNNRFLQNCDKK